FFLILGCASSSTLFPYTTLFRSSGLATSLKLLGVANLQLGYFAEADRFFDEGLAIYETVGDRRNSAAMLSNLGESGPLRQNSRVDRKSTRLNSSHDQISYAVFCL